MNSNDDSRFRYKKAAFDMNLVYSGMENIP